MDTIIAFLMAAAAIYAAATAVRWQNRTGRAWAELARMTEDRDRYKRMSDQRRDQLEVVRNGRDDLSARHDALTGALRSALSAASDPDVDDPPF